MVIVDCPYPGCTFNNCNVDDALAGTLLHIHTFGIHSGGTPDGGQNNATSTTVVVCVKKVWHQHPTISAGSFTEAWSYLNIRWRLCYYHEDHWSRLCYSALGIL